MDPSIYIQKAKDLRTACYSCKKCPLGVNELDGFDPHVFGYGNVASPIIFMAEAPGLDETRLRAPLVGKSGQIYQKFILDALGFDRKDIYTTNAVLCRPPNNRKPTPEERSICLPHLVAQFNLIKPELVVVLGVTPMAVMLGVDEGITNMAGKIYRSGGFGVDVFVLTHPSWIIRTGQYDLLKGHVKLLKEHINTILYGA